MIVIAGVVERIHARLGVMLHLTIDEAVTVVGARQDGVKIKNGNVGERVIRQPVVDEPIVEGACIGGVGRIGEGRSGDDNKEFVGAGGEIFEDGVVDIFCAADGHIFVGAGRVVGVAIQVGIREAGFEHNDLVFAAGVSQSASVV